MAALELFKTTLFNDANLVSYWRMEGNSNDAKDSNNGVDTAITYSAGNGKFGQGGGFVTASGSVITVADSANLSLTGNFTIFAWINPTAVNVQMGITEKYDANALNGYAFRMQSTGVLQGFTFDTVSNTANAGSAVLTANVWTFICYVYNATNGIIYINGSQDASSANTRNPTDGATALKIGARGNDSLTNFNGAIDDVAIFNRALSATEISNHWNGTNGTTVGATISGFFET